MVAHALMMADHFSLLGKEKVEKMDKELLKETFRAYKKASGVKYAITNPDSLGDCQSCVNYALSKKYGEDSKGIWAKHWTRGMNGDGDLADTDCVYIAHDITEELADTFYEVFGKAYNIFPSAYDPYTCFHLYEKDKAVFKVSRTMSKEWSAWGREESSYQIVVGRDRLYKLINKNAESLKDEDCGIKSFSVERIF